MASRASVQAMRQMQALMCRPPAVRAAVQSAGRTAGGGAGAGARIGGSAASASTATVKRQGLTLAHFTAELEDLRDTSLPFIELNLSTFGTHLRLVFGSCGGHSKLKLGGKGQSKLKLS
jgi:hypothetical protein